MSKKSKLIILISGVLVVVIGLVLLIILLPRKNKWIPSVQGSHVIELPFQAIEQDYKIEKYTDYALFKDSEFADYNFISQKTAKEERYSSEYFKTRDLIVILFNNGQKGIDYTVADVKVSGNDCTIELLAIKRISKLTEESTTYGCFVETNRDVSSLSVNVEITKEITHESQSFSYITDGNQYYTFPNQTMPIVFRIDSKAGIGEFFDNDGVLSKQSYIYVMLNQYGEDVFTDSSLLLIRVPSSDFENCVAFCDGENITVLGAKSNHYLYKNETPHHKLIAMLIPKDFEVGTILRSIYTEYEDDMPNTLTNIDYTISDTNVISVNLKTYCYSEND